MGWAASGQGFHKGHSKRLPYRLSPAPQGNGLRSILCSHHNLNTVVYQVAYRKTEADEEPGKCPVNTHSKHSPAEGPAGGTLRAQNACLLSLPYQQKEHRSRGPVNCLKSVSKIPVCLHSSLEMALQGCVTLSKRFAHSEIRFHGPLDVFISFCKTRTREWQQSSVKRLLYKKSLTLTVSRQQKLNKGLQSGGDMLDCQLCPPAMDPGTTQ